MASGSLTIGRQLLNPADNGNATDWSSSTAGLLMECSMVKAIPAKSDAQNVPSFRRRRFEMKLSPF